MTPQLCLGTAQFGMAYGITNALGQVPEVEVERLLKQAEEAGICWLDTAQAYGNAEAVLGRALRPGHDFRLISKLPRQSQPVFTAQDVVVWEQAFQASRHRLRLKSLDTLLLHSPSDLLKSGANHLETWLVDLRERGLVHRIGVSIYSAEDLVGVNPDLLDLVQLPLSLYDQRLLNDGTIEHLLDRGVALHARSLFLQGLLLTPSTEWPKWAPKDASCRHRALEACAEAKRCKLIDLSLGFAKALKNLEAVVLGVCNVRQLVELRESWASCSPWQEDEWQTWRLEDPAILDPRRWPQR